MASARLPGPWRVFLSRTTELSRLPADRSFATAASSAVRKAGHVAVDMDDFSASPNPPAHVCRERIENADVFVGIVGFDWGSAVVDEEDQPTSLSYTEFEFHAATSMGKVRLIFLLSDNFRGGSPSGTDQLSDRRQEAFRAGLAERTDITYCRVSSPAELEVALLQALQELSSANDRPRNGRSAYLQQVARIAPPKLLERNEEIAKLAAFCVTSDVEPGVGQYMWWRAPAWSGKSALLSTFVVHPPEPVSSQVHLVSFFITARLAAQETRGAFIKTLSQQLAEVTGEEVPIGLDEVAQENQMLGLLRHAALACRANGQRLVLVVDGLDEDRSPTTGPDAHSIAGLLPAEPPGDMRIIVAGRPNPPIPEDVAFWHPLRDPRIVENLSSSNFAQGLRQRGEQELRRLLYGSQVDQDMLGLLTAARGGLSGPDLNELSGQPLWEIEDALHGVSGRTFTRRVGDLQGEVTPEIYLLGHEELQNAAERYLGESRIEDYRQRLHSWADSYRTKRWPPRTPNYLLAGYFRLLATAGDLPRLVLLATDAARHDRMLAATGSDAAGLTEIRATLDLIVTQDSPDLAASLTLAYHRDRLADRNTNIPAKLASVWATLGHTARAAALADSITDPFRRAEAASGLLRVMSTHSQTTGHTALTISVAAEAVVSARTISDPQRQADALMGLSRALLEATCIDQAATAARAIKDPIVRASQIVAVARSSALAGDPRRAASLAAEAVAALQHGAVPAQKVHVLAEVIGLLIPLHRATTILELAAAAREAIRCITNPELQADASQRIAVALVEARQPDRATEIAGAIDDQRLRAEVLRRLVPVLVAAGHRDTAIGLTRSIEDPFRRLLALTDLASGLITAGYLDLAAGLGAEAVSIAKSVTSLSRRVDGLVRAARVLIAVGDVHSAAASFQAITDLEQRSDVLAGVAEELADAGRAIEAAKMIAVIPVLSVRANAFTKLAESLRYSDDQLASHFAAEAVGAARSDPHPYFRVRGMLKAAHLLAGTGAGENFRSLAADATVHAAEIVDVERRCTLLIQLLELAVVSEDMTCAAEVLGNITPSIRAIRSDRRRLDCYTSLIRAISVPALQEWADALAVEFEEFVMAITNRFDRLQALAAVAHTLAFTNPVEALRLGRVIKDPGHLLGVAAEIIQGLAADGREIEATAFANEIVESMRQIPTKRRSIRLLVDTAKELSIGGSTPVAIIFADQAVRSTSTIVQPGQRAEVLIELVQVLGAIGHTDAASACADDAVRASSMLADLYHRARSLAGLARALMRIGDSEMSVSVASMIPDPYWQAEMLAELSGLLVDESVELAATAVRSVLDPFRRATAMAELAMNLANGNPADAVRLASEAAVAARAVTNADRQSVGLVDLTRALAEAGAFDEAVACAQAVGRGDRQADVLTELAQDAIVRGNLEQAARAASMIVDGRRQAGTLAAIVRASVAARDFIRGEEAAGAILDAGKQADMLSVVALAAVRADSAEDAVKAARRISDPDRRVDVLVDLSRRLVRTSNYARVAALVAEAVRALHGFRDITRQVVVLGQLAEVLAIAGDLRQAIHLVQRAGEVAQALEDPHVQVNALVRSGRRLSVESQPRLAAEFAAGAIDAARAISSPTRRAEGLADIAQVLSESEQADQAALLAGEAAEVAREAGDPVRLADALPKVVAALVRSGCHPEAMALVQEAHEAASEALDPLRRARALARVASVLATTGRIKAAATLVMEAAKVARSVPERERRASALAAVAMAMAEIGRVGDAVGLMQSMSDLQRRSKALIDIKDFLASTGRVGESVAVADAVAHPYQRARALADLVEIVSVTDSSVTGQEVIERAIAAARRVVDLEHQGSALIDVALAAARSGVGDPVNIVSQVTNRARRMSALAQIARIHEAAGRCREAVAAAGQILDPEIQAATLVELARTMYMSGREADAIAAAEAIGAAESQALALTELARAMAAVGSTAYAVEAARVIRDVGQQVSALIEVARHLTDPRHRPGFADLVQEIAVAAGRMANPSDCARAFAEVARIVAAVGELDQAGLFVGRSAAAGRKTEDPFLRAAVLADLAQISVAANLVEQANDLIEESRALAGAGNEPLSQAEVLTRQALALHAVGQPGSAKRAVAEACRIGRWHSVLTAALQLDPLVLSTVLELSGVEMKNEDPAARPGRP